MSSELMQIKNQFEELQRRYRDHLPKVDPGLLDDLLLRQLENPRDPPMYMVEVFTEPGLDTEKVREIIISRTGQSPAIYDNGTHYATNHRLTLEMLKEISEQEGVIEVTGEYTGGIGSWGASHEHGQRRHREDSGPTADLQTSAINDRIKSDKTVQTETRIKEIKRKAGYRGAIYAAAGIVGAIALAGFVLSGGLLPNSNSNSPLAPGTEPGLVHGFVSGPGGLPAIGASVLAVQQGTSFVSSAFVSANGQYSLDLPPGSYIMVVAFPDGTERVVANVEVDRGVTYEFDFSY